MPNKYYEILSAIRDAVAGASKPGMKDVVIRDLPKASETLDSLPLTVVAPSEQPEEVTRLSFEADASHQVIYSADVVSIAAGNRDFESKLETTLGWRQTDRQLFQDNRLDGVPEVFLIEIRPFAPLDRGLLNSNYIYSGISLRLYTVEGD